MSTKVRRRRRRVMAKSTSVTVMIAAVALIAILISLAQLRRPPKPEFTSTAGSYTVLLLEEKDGKLHLHEHGTAMPQTDTLQLLTAYFAGGETNADQSVSYAFSDVFEASEELLADAHGFILADGEGYLAVKDGSSYRLYCVTAEDETSGKGIAYETLADRIKEGK